MSESTIVFPIHGINTIAVFKHACIDNTGTSGLYYVS